MSATKLTQKDYLKKYLSKGDGSKAKKKKKRVKAVGEGLKIIDDDIRATDVQYSNEVELEFMLAEEDAPQVAEIIDETKMMISRTTENWKAISDDSPGNKWGVAAAKQNQRENGDNDLSPVRRQSKNETIEIKSDGDNSPPRRGTIKEDVHSKDGKPRTNYMKEDHDDIRGRRDYRHRNNRMKDEYGHEYKKTRHDDDDNSPPRKNKYDRKHPDFGQSNSAHADTNRFDKERPSGYKNRYNKPEDDQSPPRKSNYERRDEISKRKNHDYSDNDQSPPRKSSKDDFSKNEGRRNYSDDGPLRKSRHDKQDITRNQHSRWDDDESPPRRQSRETNYRESYNNKEERYTQRQRLGHDDDLSPPRKSNKINESTSKNYDDRRSYHENKLRNKHESDSDCSPPRRDNSGPQKMTKTLDGKTAGLQDARSLRNETEKIRRKEKDLLVNMNDELSGRYAKTVSRKSTRKEESDDEETKKIKEAKDKERKEKYSRWGKGLKQVADQQARVERDLHEMSKPLARYADDQDLEQHLRDQIHLEDPMLRYMQQKKMEKDVERGIKVRPQYQGSFPMNRFDIRPGYRWDGVDRSNGYEKSWFEKLSSKKANEEEAYKWSTEDM